MRIRSALHWVAVAPLGLVVLVVLIFRMSLQRTEAAGEAGALAEVVAAQRNAGLWIVVVTGLFSAAFLAVVWLIRRRIGRSLAELRQAVQAAAHADLGVAVPADGLGEIGELGRALNDMLRRVNEGRRELEAQIGDRQRAEAALRLEEARREALLRLNQMTNAPLQEITDFALEGAVRLTRSGIGYLAFTNEDETVLTMHSWSKSAMAECEIADKPLVYPVVATGLWGEAVRQRRPVVTNDYAAPNPLKKGYPEGHVAVTRHMNIPVFDGERIVAVAGVGNKEDPYDDSDVRQLTLLMQGMWRLLQRREAEEELRKARDALEIRVQERTAALARAIEELKQERNLLHVLMDNLPHNIYFKDTQSRFLRINRAMADWFRLKDASDAVGKTDLDFFTHEHARQALADEREILRTGQPVLDKEEKETWPDRHTTWATSTKMPLYDDAGRIVGTFGISRDITRQKLAEDALRTSEMRYRTLYNSSRDAIMMLTPEEGFFSGNPAAVELFKCRDEAQFASLAPADLSPQHQPDGSLSSVKAQQMMATAMARGSHCFQWTHQRLDGSEFFASVLLTRMELEGKTILQATVRDITEQQSAAEALRAAKEAAEAASRAKSTFLANMSHEIRTPLNAVIGMTELVLDTRLSSQQREFLTVVRESGEALLSVINDILDFSKIEAGKLVLDNLPFDLRESLGDAMKSFALRAHKQGLELACHIAPEVPGMLVGDPNRLRQIVVNLVGNAVKFTERGEVVLDVCCESRDAGGAMLHFAVSDTGIGIPADKRADIFHPFEQADTTMTRKYGGTGLGLAISSRLVDRMGGRIWLESQTGRGSTFHFTVRFAAAEGEPAKASPVETTCVHGLRVLVVDDNATNRRILDEMLRSWTMLPTTAPGAREALGLLRRAQQTQQPYRLVLTDAHMPDMDGFALAEQIAGDPQMGSTIIMMLTSGDHPDDVARCEELGISAYLLKPIKQSELFDAIMLALGVTTATDEESEPRVSPRQERAGPLHILLAEDSLVNQKLAVALLERQGHTVFVVNNGREAVTAVEAQHVDLVLMDVQMPEMDGLDAAAAIRAREKKTGRHVPIVAMTAHALKGDRERCLAAGMDDYIAKPIRVRQLLDAIDALLGAAPKPESSAPRPVEPVAEPAECDWSEALRMVKGDHALLKILVETFLEEAPRLTTRIGEAIAHRDAAALRLAAHTLKGSLRYFGAASAVEDAYQLETMGQDANLEHAESVLQRLAGRLRGIASILSRYLQQGNAAS